MDSITLNKRAAGEHGIRCKLAMQSLQRAVAIAQRQGAPCLSERELDHLAQQAWANAKLAAHHAMKVTR